jgi:hypothetical protein
MTIKLLIGLAGPARCGKSTAQRIFAERFGLARINFADPIKEGLGAMLDLDVHALDGAAKETPLPGLGKSPRELMQTLGTEWGRHQCGSEFWIRVAQRRLAMLEDIEDECFQGAVFSDVRFEEEAAWIRAQGGQVIHLTRTDAAPVRGHASEAGVARAPNDAIVCNDVDLDDLDDRLTQLIDTIIDQIAEGALP